MTQLTPIQTPEEPGSGAQQLGESIYRFERWVEEQCGKGYRMSMELMIERIIADNRLKLSRRLRPAE